MKTNSIGETIRQGDDHGDNPLIWINVPPYTQASDPTPNTQHPTPNTPLALYVHIPFCVRKCHYCDFASGPAPEQIREQYVDALVEEIRRSPWAGQPARTVFFGGGTPSELKTPQLRRITQALQETFVFPEGGDVGETARGQTEWGNGGMGEWGLGEAATPDATLPPLPAGEGARGWGLPPTPKAHRPTPPPEWTIECNPGTVDDRSLAEMREMGFNRISLGVQSFHDHHLKSIGRIHTAREAAEALFAARRAGFRRLNLDLIFCLPGQTLDEWKADLERALELEPEHISLYNLTIEEKSEYGRRHRMGLLSLPDEDLSADMYEWAIQRTSAAGFELYEVSNFARPGEECRHNQVYWRQEPFLGFGLSAASYLDGLRWSNVASMQRYLASAARPGGPERASEERLPPLEALGEAIMLGLRTREGADLDELGARYGIDPQTVFGESIRQLTGDGLLLREGGRLRLTHQGVMLANRVCAEFLA